jgi:dCMP deaminase
MSDVIWPSRWLDTAFHFSSWSKDQSSKVGAVIVGERQRLLSVGYNGLPTGMNDSVRDHPERHERPEKYFWYEHAERNAIYSAAYHGISLRGSAMFCTAGCCPDCARAIVQSGIRMFVFYKDSPFAGREDWQDRFKRSRAILAEGGVTVAGNEGYSNAT